MFSKSSRSGLVVCTLFFILDFTYLRGFSHLTSLVDILISHGNGTQQIFYENPNVLYISLHRWDNGHFYPFTGAPDECGEEAGEGKNVNIAWSSYGRGAFC